MAPNARRDILRAIIVGYAAVISVLLIVLWLAILRTI
jgi:hypothetical protein